LCERLPAVATNHRTALRKEARPARGGPPLASAHVRSRHPVERTEDGVKLTPEGEKVARQMAMTGDQDALMAGLLETE
jgi:hypothetical protein